MIEREDIMQIKKETPTVDTYLDLREKVGWKKLSRTQAQRALDNSLAVFVAYDNEEPVGMGRLVGDGAVICYIQDLIVIPRNQKSGVGSELIEALISEVSEISEDNTEMMLALMCAKGREFYHKHGFISRPTKDLGPGMIRYLKK